MRMMSAIGYATSNAHGCPYCQVHSAATGGEQSPNLVEQSRRVREKRASSILLKNMY